MEGVAGGRIWQGFLWGVAATVAMTIAHVLIWALTGRLTVVPLATRTLPGSIIAKILGPALSTSAHPFLAALIHVVYGGFWGGVLFALVPRVKFWHGAGVGAFNLSAWESFCIRFFAGAEPGRLFAIFFPMATHFTYGATLGFLGWLAGRQESVLAPA